MDDLIGTPAGGAADLVKDATIETFQADVLQASMQVPVVVDFWASWCGPCRTLGPILENQVIARKGAVRMVKVDTDANQMLAQQLRIQSLPTVMAFIGGQPVDGFQGALPESEVSAFLDRVTAAAAQAGLAGTGPDLEGLLTAAKEALAAADIATAMQAFGAVADAAEAGSDTQVEAFAGMAQAALAAGQRDQATQMLGMVPDGKKQHPAVAQVTAQLALGDGASDGAELATQKAAAAANPTDPEAQFALAEAFIDAGDMENGVSALLDSIELDKDWNEAAARQKLLTVFDALGATDDIVKKGRRRLSAVLFS